MVQTSRTHMLTKEIRAQRAFSSAPKLHFHGHAHTINIHELLLQQMRLLVDIKETNHVKCLKTTVFTNFVFFKAEIFWKLFLQQAFQFSFGKG